MPLGNGALVGNPFPIDRDQLAQDLGFDAPTPNSMDGVSDPRLRRRNTVLGKR